MKAPPKTKRLAFNVTAEMHGRLLAAVELLSASTGLSFVSMANVVVLAIDLGLKHIEEENHNAAGRS